ncbi:MAG: insulinase family protein [Actinomycetota bacterium]
MIASRPVLTVFVAAAMVATSCTGDDGPEVADSSSTIDEDAVADDTDDGGSSASTGGGSEDGAPDPGADADGEVDTDTDGDEADGSAAVATPPDFDGLPSLADPDPETLTGTLDNGLRYLVRANDNPGSKVDLRLAVDAGSVLETPLQLGGAHFLEHMLFNGTERFPKNELIDTLRSFGAAFGADVNAYTAFDETVYSLNVPNDDESVELALDVFEQWLSFALIEPDEVEAERGIILDEWRVRDQTANGRLLTAISEFYLDGTAYENRLPIGDQEAILALDAELMRQFYEDWYRPDITSVIVVGDIDPTEVEELIVERFADVQNPADAPPRPELLVDPLDVTRALVLDDPDLDDGFASVALPAEPIAGLTPEAESATMLLQGIAFEVIATRLQNDALRGDAPFDSAGRTSAAFTRGAIGPEISVDLDGADVADAVETIVDEFERVLRFGFTSAEVERAVGSARSNFQQTFDGRNSRQDSSYADEYVRHVLEDEWYVTADREFEFYSEVLDRVTPENLLFVFADLVDRGAPHVVVAVPADEATDTASEGELIAIVDGARDRAVEPRADDAAIGDSLMSAPEPVDVVDRFQLSDETFTPILDPTVVRFANGVTVAFNRTQIVEGEVFLSATSPGGLAAVADEDVPDADAVRDVVGQSGVADFDPVSLDAFLDDKQVSLTPFIDQFEEGWFGTSTINDVEVLFQLIHLGMTAPRVDQVALERYVDDLLPLAENPSLDAGYAEQKALLDARYGDEVRFLLPTPESLAAVDADGVLAVARDRFGDAGDWTFSFSGDLDIETGIDLAARYLGTLPSTDRDDSVVAVEPPPPPGAVVSEVEGGQGEQANVSFLFTGAASAGRLDDVVARVVDQIVSNRLTDVIREELGDSYSPFGVVSLGRGDVPQTEVYISVSTAPDQIDEVSTAVLGQVEDLGSNGPSQREFDNAVATVAEELNFVNNNQINLEVLGVLVDPAGNADFDDFVFEFELIEQVTLDAVTTALGSWTSTEQFIEIRVVPRS